MQAVFSDYAKGCAGPQGYGMMREEEPQISQTADRPSGEQHGNQHNGHYDLTTIKVFT